MHHDPLKQIGAAIVQADPGAEPEVQLLLVQLLELSARLSTALRPCESKRADASCCLQLAADILRFRKQRNRMFGEDLFGEPAWDILLELYMVGQTGRKLSVSGACYSSGVPISTALRWISRLEREGWIVRIDDPLDKRRSWLTLSEEAEAKMHDLLSRMAA